MKELVDLRLFFVMRTFPVVNLDCFFWIYDADGEKDLAEILYGYAQKKHDKNTMQENTMRLDSRTMK